MDSDEVIIEKVIENRNLHDELKKHILHTEKNNYVSNNENSLLKYKENIQININETSKFADNSKPNVINNIEIEQNYSEINNLISEENNSITSHINRNEVLINDPNKKQDHITFKKLKHEDNDIHIICEKNTVSLTQKNDKVSSLVSIALEYGNSDSETEYNSEEIKCENNESKSLKEIQVQTYRQNKEASSDEESESQDDSSSSDSSVIIQSNESDDSDDCLSKKSMKNNIKRQKNNEIKNELDDLPPIEDLKISVPEVLCDPLGEVAWMVEQLVVVKPKPGKPTLNLDTVLFVEKGQRALGKIFDVFGKVNEPHYCVRFNSSKHIKECDIKEGMTVYYCPNTEYTSLVFLHELLKIKGIDANADDPPEFSDDEEERAYYEQLKAKQVNANQSDIPSKRKRISKPNTGWQSNHPWNRNVQRQKKEFYTRTNRQFFFENQSQTLWPQAYQNNSESYGYGTYSMQPMQYINRNVGNANQNLYSSRNYYNEDNSTTYLNPRIPFTTCPRISPGYLTLQNHPNSFTNVRFQSTNIPWLSQIPQVPTRMKVPWVSLPPPPPPPPLPPPSSPPSTSSTNTY